MNSSQKIGLHTAAFLLGAISLFWAWFGTLAHLADIVWNVDSFSHGILVPFASAGLLWSRRTHFSASLLSFDWRGTAIVLLSGLLWLLGEAGDAKFLSHVALISAFQGLLMACYGRALFYRFLFPLLFLYLAIPIGISLIPILQTVTAEMVIAVLPVLGVPVEADGVLITISSGIYEVARACAGIKFLFTSLVTGALLANLAYSSLRGRVLILIAAALIPIVANALRVLGILLISEATDQSFAKGVDHVVYGWGFLSFVLFALIALAYRYADKVDEVTPASNLLKTASNKPLAFGFAMIIPAVAIIMAPLAAVVGAAKSGVSVTVDALAAPECQDCDYRLLPEASGQGVSVFRGSDQQYSFAYRNAADTFVVSAGLYCPLRPGDSLLQKGVLPVGHRWEEVAGDALEEIHVGIWRLQPRTYSFRDKKRHVLVGYFINGNPQVSGLAVRFETVKQRLLQGTAAGAVLVISSTAYDGSARGGKKITKFLSTFSYDRFLWHELFSSPKGRSLCAA